jgi:hypothetical protein
MPPKKISKKPFDKWYTPSETADRLIQKTFEIVGDGVTEIVEPSAGAGAFSFPILFSSELSAELFAYDIEPEDPHPFDHIIKQDFLTLPLEYKRGRLFIGNPPFGGSGGLLKKFYYKCFEYGDYVAFISCPSWTMNHFITHKENHFELVYTEKINDFKEETGMTMFYCIFKRIKSSPLIEFTKRYNIKLVRDGVKNVTDYQNWVCQWGASVGKRHKKDGSLFARNEIIESDSIELNKLISYWIDNNMVYDYIKSNYFTFSFTKNGILNILYKLWLTNKKPT